MVRSDRDVIKIVADTVLFEALATKMGLAVACGPCDDGRILIYSEYGMI